MIRERGMTVSRRGFRAPQRRNAGRRRKQKERTDGGGEWVRVKGGSKGKPRANKDQRGPGVNSS
jgi:hypothetical protein